MIKILFLGYGTLAQGFYGLYNNRYEIRGIKRTPIPDHPCPVVLMSIQNENLRPHLEWSDVVIFCPSSGGGDFDHYQETYLGNINFVIALIQRYQISIQNFVLIGSTGVYAKSIDRIGKEQDPIPVESPRQEVLRKTEQVVSGSGLPYAILRCGGLYGPVRSNFSRLIKRGEILSSELLEQHISLVHQDDVCAIINRIIELKKNDVIYNVVDDSNFKRIDLYQLIAKEAGLPVIDTGVAPLTAARLITNTTIKESLGYRFRHSLTQTTLRELLNSGHH